MSANPWQAYAINSNLLFNGDGTTSITSGVMASEIPLVPDGINKNLSNYTQIMGCWNGYAWGITNGYQSEASRNAGTWWQDHGYQYNWAARSRGSFFFRVVSFNDEITRYGYISSLVGGMWATNYVFDQVDDNNISYETPYGHGAAVWPVSNTDQGKAQFRDSTSLPSDGSSRILLTGSAYNRSPYLHPVYYVAHVITGGALSSGAVQFIVEQRPSWRMTQGLNASSHSPTFYGASGFFPDVVNAQEKFLTAAAWLAGHVVGQAVSYTYIAAANVLPDSATATAILPILRTVEPRVRKTAAITINAEYYAEVFGSLLMVFSSKLGHRPLYLYDFAQTTWASSTYKRIAGIAVDGLNIWVLSESGDLALVDFSVSGGQVLVKAQAPAVTGEDRYGALVKQGTSLWALVGSYSESTIVSTTTGIVGIIPYAIAGNTWGTRSDSTLAARHNTRSVHELIALADGRLAALVEDVAAAVPAPATVFAPGTTAASKSSNTNVPENQTFITRLPGNLFPAQGRLSRVKIGFGDIAFGKIAATIKWVPKGSPTGTAFSGSAQCLFGGLVQGTLGTATTWTAPTLTSDWVTLPWDPSTYDYYLYTYLADGTYSATTYYTAFSNTAGGQTTYPGAYSALVAGDSQGDTTSPALPLYTLGPVYGIYSDPADTFAGVTNTALVSLTTAWQVMVFNPTGSAWNTTKVTTPAFNYGTGTRTGYEALQNAPAFMEVSANKLLVQANWRNTKVFLVNVAGTLDATAIQDVSWGQAQTIFSSGMNLNTPTITFLKNAMDNSVACFLHTFTVSYDWAGNPTPIATARPDFVWDGTEQMVLHPGNAYGSGATTSIAKDALYPSNIQASVTVYAAGYMREWTYPVHYADNQITLLHLGSLGISTVSSDRFSHGVYYLPRYWKWSGGVWKVAANWADAAANPYTVPATPDTAIPVMHGLVFSFGPSTTTTFQTGEFHTVNVTYGQVKFARRTRWDFTMFAGRTFHNKETKNVADLPALGYRWLSVSSDKPPTLSGPTGITTSSAAGDTTGAIWPVASAGVGNDAPAVLTYDLTAMPTVVPTPAVAIVMSTPVSTWGYSSADEYWRADYGTGVTKIIKSYSFSRYSYSDTRAMAKWLFQGSNDASDTPTTWVTLDTIVGYPWPPQVNGVVVTAHRDISSNTTGYRHYRLLLQAEANGKMRVSTVNLYEAGLGNASFADLAFGPMNQIGTYPFVYGLKFEVNAVAAPDTAGFSEITPKFRAHNGLFYCFDRQQNVKQLRITSTLGAWYSDTQRICPGVQLWDYASQAVMDNLRLGSSAAANNTRERGTFDPECIGVGCDATAIWIDSNSPVMWTPQYTSAAYGLLGWFSSGGLPPAGKFQIHPYYGFIRLPAGTTGTTLHVSYAWGRRA